MKRILVVLLVFALTLGTVCPYVQAEEVNSQKTETAEEISFDGENGFGEMISQEFEATLDSQEENNGYNIYSVEISENLATVVFDVEEDCELVVVIYDESGIQMLASGTTDVLSDITQVQVTIETYNMPQYFYVRAFLVEPDTLRPLGSAYESPIYTQEMQDFLKKTTNDFDSERVLNLDEDETNNFAVFDESIIVIPESTTENIVISTNEETNTYVIENADALVQGLQPGDIFAHEYGENAILIVKVVSIVMDGTKATISGEEISLEEVFEYVKIDGSGNTEDAQIDDSMLEEGITYEGLEEVEQNQIAAEEFPANQIGYEGSKRVKAKFKLWDKKFGTDNNYVKLSGNANISLTGNVKLYITRSEKYVEVTIDVDMSINGTISGKITGAKCDLAMFIISPIAGVYIKVTPSIVFTFEAELTFSVTAKDTVGGSFAWGKGFKNLTRKGKVSADMKSEGKFFIGLSLEGSITIISPKIAKGKLTFTVGAQLELKQNFLNNSVEEVVPDELHMCKKCLGGEINWIAGVNLSVTLLNLDRISFEVEDTRAFKISDIHYSFDYNDLGLTTCPYQAYKVELIVQNENGNPISGVTINAPFRKKNDIGIKEIDSISTDINGKAIAYLPAGSSRMLLQKDGYMPKRYNVRIKDEAIRIVIEMSKNQNIEIQNDVTIDSNCFPDVNFRQYVLTDVDKNSDGVLSKDEISSCKNIDVSDCSISSLTGIEYFTNLEKLSCGHNNLTSLDVSKNVCLKNLSCNSNNLSKLDISKNVNLRSLFCSYNNLSSLDVSKNIALYFLFCSNNNLSSLDVSRNLALEDLNCSNNNISNLEISRNVLLETLDCRGNNLSSLDVNENVALTELCCDENELVCLNVDNNVELRKLLCSDNSLSNLNVSKNTKLELLYCDNNDLNILDVSNLTNLESLSCYGNQLGDLDVSRNLLLKFLICSNNNLDCLDVSNNTLLKTLWCYSNNFSSLDVSNNEVLEELWCDTNVTVVGWPKETISEDCGEWNDSQIMEENEVISLLDSKDKIHSIRNEIDIVAPIDVFTNLCANEIYNYYILKNSNELAALEPDNILYMTQAISDENGILTIDYIMREEYENAECFVVAQNQTDISEASVTVKNVTYTGNTVEVQPIVKMNDMTLIEGKDYRILGEFSESEVGEYSFTIEGLGYYCGTIEQTWQIMKPTIKVTNITLNKESVSLITNRTMKLTATVTPIDATNPAVSWESSDSKIATVDSTGKITAKSAGTATITCTAKDGSGVKATCKVTVTDPVVKVTKITLNKTSASLVKGKTLQLTATVTPSNATDKAVTWASSNTKVATVSSTGKITAKSTGTTTITCTAKDGSGVKSNCKITVTNPVIKVTKLTLNLDSRINMTRLVPQLRVLHKSQPA